VGTDIRFSKNTHILYTHNNADVNESLIGKVSMSGPGASINEVSLHGDVINKILQNIDYTYNIRGWLTDINKVKTTVAPTKSLFNFKINYNTTNAGATPLYNGNISETFWNTKNDDDDVRGYKYTYDQLNRIKIAKFTKGTGINNQEEGFFYDVENITYDTNGNIQSLFRSGSTDEESIAIWDDLTYTYSGNKLLKVDDEATISDGFIDGNPNSTGVDDYRYDANGNMTVDKNKNIKRIFYNHLNLPTRIEFENQDDPENLSNYIEYTYDATGLKMKKEVMPDGAPPQITEYAGSYIYSDSDSVNNLHLQFISHPEGYIIPTVIGGTRTSKSVKGFKKDTGETTYSDYAYVFQYKDHLGNVRLSYSDANLDGAIQTEGDASEIIEESNYYPFGLQHKGYNNVITSTNLGQKEKTFQGQRLDDDLGLNWHTFKWRNYDASLARFHNIDPLAEEFVYNSPYNFAENRVIDGVELEGLEWENFMSSFKKTSNLNVKPVPSGKGVQNQSYSVVVQNPKKALSDLRSTFRDSPQDVLSNSKATFQPVDKNGNDLTKANLGIGSDIEIAIDGPMNNSAVRVTGAESDDNSFSYTFGTLEGHIEAGEISFSASTDKNGNITFGINSTSKVDMTLAPDGFSRKQQAKSWQEVLTNVVNYLQGTEESRSATTKNQEEDKK